MKASMETFVGVTSIEAFVEAFMEALVKISSMEAFSNAFVGASKKVLRWKLSLNVRGSHSHGFSHEIIRGNYERFRGSNFHRKFIGNFLRTFYEKKFPPKLLCKLSRKSWWKLREMDALVEASVEALV